MTHGPRECDRPTQLAIMTVAPEASPATPRRSLVTALLRHLPPSVRPTSGMSGWLFALAPMEVGERPINSAVALRMVITFPAYII